MQCETEGCNEQGGYRGSLNCPPHYAERERCIAEDCRRLPRRSSKYCDKHAPLKHPANYTQCAYELCERRAQALGYCAPHRQQIKGGKELKPLRVRPTGEDRFCSFDGCRNRKSNRGLCQAHSYQRDHGKNLTPVRQLGPRQEAPECSFRGCHRLSKSGRMLLCPTHYEQKRKGGPLTPIGLPKSKGGHITAAGYRLVSTGGRYTPEHRAVMEGMIGRLLLRQETVHHINGDKLDNRPENLELWVSAHLKGQRVQDLVDFVVNTYPQLVEKRLRQPLLFVA